MGREKQAITTQPKDFAPSLSLIYHLVFYLDFSWYFISISLGGVICILWRVGGRTVNRLSGKWSARSTVSDWLFIANIRPNLQNVTNLKDCRPKAVTSSRHANLVQLSAMPLPKAGPADAQRK